MFEGFPPEGLRFLRALKRNNDRTWFNARKEIYEEHVRAPLMALVDALADECERARLPFAPDPRRPAFRIHRDVRFSNDKSPYKTWVSTALLPHGDREAPGILYVHVDPAEPFTACGFYQPESAALRTMRAAIANDATGFLKIVRTLEKRGLQLRTSDTLKRVPRGFEALRDSPVEPYVKLQSFVTSLPFEPSDLGDPKLPNRIATFAKSALPLLEWGWNA